MKRQNPTGILAVLLIVLLFFASCNSFERNHRKVPELKGVLLEDIEVLLAEGFAVDAVQDIDFLYRQGRIGKGEKERFEERAITDIRGAFQENVENQDYYGAYRYYLALVALSQQETVPEWSASRLLTLLADGIEAQDNRLSALSIRLRILDALSDTGCAIPRGGGGYAETRGRCGQHTGSADGYRQSLGAGPGSGARNPRYGGAAAQQSGDAGRHGHGLGG
jgi:hypothetical protein